jgi:hypothetical protein
MSDDEGVDMRTIARLAVLATAAATAGALLATPAQAAELPAVTSCYFTPLYATYSDGRLSDLKYYYPRDTALTVADGDAHAWHVTVNRNGQQGWMEANCVSFLA